MKMAKGRRKRKVHWSPVDVSAWSKLVSCKHTFKQVTTPSYTGNIFLLDSIRNSCDVYTLTHSWMNVRIYLYTKFESNESIWTNVWINICDQYIQIYNRHTLICIYICICVAVLNLEEHDEAGDPGEKHRHAVNYSWWCRVAEISIKHGFCSSPSLPWSVQF